ncbi:MAG: VWA domain-containing protein [Acidobacteriota bacterium]
MRRSVYSFVAIGVLVALAAPALGGLEWAAKASQQPGATFRSGTRLVPIYATVTDAQDRLVPDLVREDFEVLDNNVRQNLLVFENQIQPITAVVMLDTSGSMTDSLKLVRDGAEQFLIRLLPQDRAMVGAFNDKIEFSGIFTADRDELIAALKELDFGYPTRLNDAIDQSLDRLAGIEGRRVILLLTDGEDTASKIGQGDVLDRATADEVMIYGIGLESVYFDGVRQVRTKPDRVLRKLAEETGGGYFALTGAKDLGSAFTRIAQELRSQYVLGFAPATLDGKVHKLTVSVRKPGMRVRARKSYVASPGA